MTRARFPRAYVRRRYRAQAAMLRLLALLILAGVVLVALAGTDVPGV